MVEISRTRYSLGLRIWHWLDGVVVLGLLGTYFLRSTLFSVRGNRQYFIDKLKEHEITISDGVAKDLGRGLVDRLWEWHINLGYILAALLVLRVLVALVDRTNTFAGLLAGVRAARLNLGWSALHSVGVKVLYVFFYLLQTVMVGSGLAQVFSERLGLGEGLERVVGEVHASVMWFFLAFVVVHVVGVVVAETSSEPGLVSRMINGGS